MTPRMLRGIRKRLNPKRVHNDAVVWATLLLAFMFLMRAGEYCLHDGAGIDPKRGLRGVDVAPRCKGCVVGSFAGADEVVITIRGSKTDVLNRGEVRNHFRTADSSFCVVQALEDLEVHSPAVFSGGQRFGPLLRWQDGSYVRRSQVAALVAEAAVSDGVAAADVGTHSLRSGGASALWVMFRDSAIVQRWGRWSSQAFQGYLWEARDGAAGVADAMSRADLSLV